MAVISVTVKDKNGLTATKTATVDVTSADPWASLDGRLNAPAGRAPQLASILNGYQASRRPPWQVAGVHYGVGYPPSLVLKSPSTISKAGVSVNTSSKIVSITGDNITLDGYDFSLWGVENRGANTTILNSKFVAGSNMCICSINASNGRNLTLRYCDLDGSGKNLGYGGLVVQNMPGLTIEYCWLHNQGSDIIQANAGGAVVLRYNIIQNGGLMSGVHGDLLQTIGNTSNITEFNLIAQLAGESQGIAVEPEIGGPVRIDSVSFRNNTIITKAPGFLNFIFAVTAPDLVGNCDVSDNYFDPANTWYFSPGGVRGSAGDSYPKTRYTHNVNMVNGSIYAD